jgi:hypothetical protein
MPESQTLANYFAVNNPNRPMYDLYCEIVGKKILNLGIVDDTLMFCFSDVKVALEDDCQHCCESRYMQTDDVLTDYLDAKLISIELKPVTVCENPEHDIQHDIQFLEVVTSKGSFTCSFHNEHNGYYAGFNPILKIV